MRGRAPSLRRVGALAAALLLAPLLLLGCAHTLGELRRALREPGEKLVALPDEVSAEYACPEQTLPFFTLEGHELNPSRVGAGEEFNHRMVYVLCPTQPTAVVRGTLTTRIRFEGRVVAQEQVPDFEIKPGRWIVDAFVQLPADAEIGIYALEVLFESEGVKLDERLTFGVDRAGPG